MKQCKHRNSTISITQDLHISLSIGDCREREREAMSICEMVKTQKWYYIHNMRSGYFPINRRLHREREREEQETEAMSICEMVKIQKLYYVCITRSGFSLSIGDCIERASERERERQWADRISGHFIWNMSSYIISVCTSSWSLHLTSSLGVYLTELSTSSANLTCQNEL